MGGVYIGGVPLYAIVACPRNQNPGTGTLQM